ncbi:MAG: rhomboid family intramembrane serine protease [Bacteroidales bacterium]|jgi:membrane associated rhomboid family serine protease|nr:rhomboid family intramembrane serine protease [Bacteroidales bacterium]MCK9498200.1 rhomboid family intramembrane serine protease [Bacteroidales bacterium]MDY0313629.1 rhomboid family intramembrane serine protease [Bacteroidales bacterium]NLB87133.1 rhomboid family intramembrane serine protease [Bacteroidales bacterium]
MNFQRGGFSNLPPVVKTLLLINIALFALKYFAPDLMMHFAVYSFKSEFFKPYQLITHMFMHGNFMHIFFNMFALFMFGRILEQVWGSQRFFIYYFFTGLGAAFLHLFIMNIEINSLMSNMSSEQINLVLNEGGSTLMQGKNYIDIQMRDLNLMINTPTVGASGAIYGLLLAFGMLFPNTILYIYAAIPMKAKYLVMIFVGIELFLGFLNRSGDNVAHFAHLGGMLFGLIFVLIWKKKQFNRWDQ